MIHHTSTPTTVNNQPDPLDFIHVGIVQKLDEELISFTVDKNENLYLLHPTNLVKITPDNHEEWKIDIIPQSSSVKTINNPSSILNSEFNPSINSYPFTGSDNDDLNSNNFLKSNSFFFSIFQLAFAESQTGNSIQTGEPFPFSLVNPTSIDIDENGEHLYISDQHWKSILVFNAVDGAFQSFLPEQDVFDNPVLVKSSKFDDKELVFTLEKSTNSIIKINPVTKELVSSFRINYDNIENISFSDFVVNKQDGTAFLLDSETNTVYKFDEKGNPVKNIKISNYVQDHKLKHLSIDHNSNQLYITDEKAKNILIFNFDIEHKKTLSLEDLDLEEVTHVEFDEKNNALYISDNDKIIRIMFDISELITSNMCNSNSLLSVPKIQIVKNKELYYNEFMKEADNYVGQGPPLFEVAFPMYYMAAILEPLEPDPWVGLGYLQTSLCPGIGHAEILYDHALSLDDDHINGIIGLIGYYFDKYINTGGIPFYLEKAEEYIVKAEAIDPKNTNMLNLKAKIQESKGEINEALIILDEALAIKEKPSTLNYKAELLKTKDDKNKNLDHLSVRIYLLERSLLIDKNNFETIYMLIQTYDEYGSAKDRDKIEDLDMSLKDIERDNAKKLLSSAEMLIRANNYDGARILLDKANEFDPENKDVHNLLDQIS
ncbi:MAG: hypothetical protein OEL84_09610 [Nitrosopumilus sp.]|nr:hypothetical protein [Nitrosopumilus sp.]